jgi:hypothetical protein
MRYLYPVLFSILLLAFYSCTDSKEKETAVVLSVANWNDTTTMGKVINNYYKDSVFKTGKIAMEIRDPFMNKRTPYHYLQLQKVLRPEFKKTSKTVGYMPVFMKGLSSDSVIVDFQLTWQQPNPTDSAGVFVVTDKSVQRVGSQSRYEWVQDGEYWIRRNVEMPQELNKMQALDPEKLKRMQESGAIKKNTK